jgi:phosphoribosylanthranilate isomerase
VSAAVAELAGYDEHDRHMADPAVAAPAKQAVGWRVFLRSASARSPNSAFAQGRLSAAAMAQAKICGLSTPETVAAALAHRAAYVGFMFFEKSPRYVTPEVAARLAAPVRGKVKTVAVMVDPSDALLREVAETLRPDFIQLHGRETPPRVREAAMRTGAGTIKVISVGEESDLAKIAEFEAVADHIMLDAKAPPGSERAGGNGVAFDWSLTYGRKFMRPWLLAGGLDPWNVVEAVRLSGAPIVDVSSGVERGAGLKDPALIEAFLGAAARA